MPKFVWEAATKDGLRKQGEIDASDRHAVLEILAKQGLVPVHLVLKPAERKKSRLSLGLKGGIGTIDKILIFKHLSVMLKAGIPLTQSLEILINDAEKNSVKKFLQDIEEIIKKGQSLWSAFSIYSQHFPSSVIGLIRAGELSGKLTESFDRAAEQMSRDRESKRRIVSAMIYPAILLGMTLILVSFLFIFAIPRLASVVTTLQTNTRQIPLFSRIVFGISDFLHSHLILVIIVLISIFALAFYAAFSRLGRGVFSKLAWHLPIIKNVIKKFALARFTSTLGSLLKSGLTAIESLNITADSVGVQDIRLAILTAKTRINQGSPFTEAFRGYPQYFPGILLSMMEVGEQSGQLSDLLVTIADFFEEDASRSLQNLITLVEPLLLLFMGLVVGSIALAVIVPVYQLVTSV